MQHKVCWLLCFDISEGVFLDSFNCSFGKSEGEIDCSWGRGGGYNCDVVYQLTISESVSSTVIGRLNLTNYNTTFCTIPKSLTGQPELQPGQKYSISIQYFASNNYGSKVMNATAVASKMLSEIATNSDICWTVVMSYFIQINFVGCMLRCLFLVNFYFCTYFMLYIFYFCRFILVTCFRILFLCRSFFPFCSFFVYERLLLSVWCFNIRDNAQKSAPEIIQLTEIIILEIC